MAEMDEGQKRRLAAQIQAIRLLQREAVVPPSLMATVRGDSYAGPAQHPLPMQDELAVAALAHHDNAKQSPAVRREPWEGPTKSLDDEVVSRMQERLLALKKLPLANMAPAVSERLHIEEKAISLFALQQKVRRGLIASHAEHCVPAPHLLPAWEQKGGMLSGDAFEREWVRRKNDMEKAEKDEKHRAFLDEMHLAWRNFGSQVSARSAMRDKVSKMLKAHLKNQEKLKDRERTERLAALKSNDFEKYREYVNNAKNERLMELIQKTDTYLNSLAAKISTATKGVGKEVLLELDQDILPLAGSEENGKEEGGGGDAEGGGKEDGEKEKKEEKKKSENQLETMLQASVSEVVLEQARMMGGKDLRLKPYQIQGVQWMVSLYNNNLSGILADEMGLGKTIQIIGLLTYVMESKKDPGPFMIIAPLSTITNWSTEFARWAPSVDVVVYKGSKDVRKNLYLDRMKGGKFNVCIIQYEIVMKPEDMRYLKKFDWSYIVVDEGHRLKNKDSRLFIVLMKEYRSRAKLILTGTPLQNNINELWNLLNFLMPAVFDTDQDFKSWFSKPFAIGEEEGDEEEEESSNEEQMVLINRLHQVLRPFMLRRVKTDKELELSMPENREVIVKVPLSGLQSMIYRRLQFSVLPKRDEKGQQVNQNCSNVLMMLRQCCNHPYLVDSRNGTYDLGYDNLVRVCGKFDVLDRILPKLQACGHRVLIYSQMVQLLDILEEYVMSKGFIYRKLVGSTSSEERAKMIDEFNVPNSEIFVFLLSTRAGGQGVNLQTADTVIIFDSDWNPMMDEQAKARINRIGQKKQTLVIRLITPSSVEERMLKRANDRLRMGDLAIESGQFKVGATAKDAQEMVKAKLDEGDLFDDITKVDADIAGDEEMNEMLMRTEEEYEVWQKMDEERARETGGKDTKRLMQENEVPESIIGPPFSNGDRVSAMQHIHSQQKPREGTVTKRLSHSDYEVRFDDGMTETHSRAMLVVVEEPVFIDEEAEKLGRRKQTKNAHAVSHHGLSDAEFTRCLEQGIDIDDFVAKKRKKADRDDGRDDGGDKRKRKRARGGDDDSD